jgi:hypothetical protein
LLCVARKDSADLAARRSWEQVSVDVDCDHATKNTEIDDVYQMNPCEIASRAGRERAAIKIGEGVPA